MTNQPLDLDTIEARTNAAEGGWHVVPDDADPYRFEIHGDGPTHIAVFGGNPDDGFASYPVRENAEFAAHARTDVEQLVAEVRRLRAELVDARANGIRYAADLVTNAFHGEPFLNYPPDFADLLRDHAARLTAVGRSAVVPAAGETGE